MDDIRKLLTDEEAATSATILGWNVRGLCSTLFEILLDGPSDDPDKAKQEHARLCAIAECALLKASALANWLDRHERDCKSTD